MIRRIVLSLLVSVGALAAASASLGDVPVATPGPCPFDFGDHPVERWFERVQCDIQRLSSLDRDLGLVEVVLGEGRLVRQGHLEPESWSSLHNAVSGTLYAAEVEREYWGSALGPIDSLLTDFAVFAYTSRSGEQQFRVYGGQSSTRDQLVVPGERVLGLVERVSFGPVLVGRTQLWKLHRALIVRPEGYTAVTAMDWTATMKRLASASPSTGISPGGEREFSVPLDAASVDALIGTLIEVVEDSREAAVD